MAKEKKTLGQRLKATQAALRRMRRELKKVDQENHQTLESLSSATNDLNSTKDRLAYTQDQATSAARLAIKYRNQRDEFDRQLFLAQRMVGNFALQASSKMDFIDLSSRVMTEDEPTARKLLNNMANGPNQNEERQQGVSSPMALTVNCRNALPEDLKKVDES